MDDDHHLLESVSTSTGISSHHPYSQQQLKSSNLMAINYSQSINNISGLLSSTTTTTTITKTSSSLSPSSSISPMNKNLSIINSNSNSNSKQCSPAIQLPKLPRKFRGKKLYHFCLVYVCCLSDDDIVGQHVKSESHTPHI